MVLEGVYLSVCLSVCLYSGGSSGVIVLTSVLLQDLHRHAIHVAARNYDSVVGAALSVIYTHAYTHVHTRGCAQ